MSKRLAFAALIMLASSGFAVAQFNGFELDNGSDIVYYFTDPSVGNVAGSGITNVTPNDQMYWTILPRELMRSSNGTNPGTLELTGRDFESYHSFWGQGGGGTTHVIYDLEIRPVSYVNPLTLVANDGRRYPDLAATPYAVVLGGASGFPIPTGGCPLPGLDGYFVQEDYGTATPGSGIILPADGATDTALVNWFPGGMTFLLPTDPSGCEIGGNFSMQASASTDEHSPVGYPSATISRNVYGGYRPNATFFNNWNVTVTQNINWVEHPQFRSPILQFSYNATGFATRQRGVGQLHMDNVALTTVQPGMRTTATGHLGELVIHVLTADLLNYPIFPQPGIAVTPTSNLLLNPGDPNFFLLTPVFDGFLGGNLTEYIQTRDTYDTPLSFSFTGPTTPPGISFAVQAFIVNIAGGPPFSVVSTNVAEGNLW